MNYTSEVLQDVKHFFKETGAPEEIVCDMSGEQTYNTLQNFCSEIGTTLQLLEEGTSWEKKGWTLYRTDKGGYPKRYEVLKIPPYFLGLLC